MEDEALEIVECHRYYRERPSLKASVNHVLTGGDGVPLVPTGNIEANNDELISQMIHSDHGRYRIKSSSFNGLTFQQLQMKRIENLLAYNRQKMSRKQHRGISLSRSRHLDNFFKQQYIPIPTIDSAPKSQDKLKAQSKALPVVRPSTKRELLRLNKRYSSSVSESQAIMFSEKNESNDRSQQYLSEPIRIDCEKENDQAFPFKLILCGINAGDSGASHSTATVISDGKQSGACEPDLGEESVDGNYLLHLEQLARESSRLYSSPATEIAYDVNDDDSTSSSCDSPTPQLQAASACDSHGGNDEGIGGSEQNQRKLDDDADSNYFSCLCKAHVLISEGRKNDLFRAIANTGQQAETQDRGYELSQNERLTRIATFIKHGMIILAIALFFASVEFVQHKILSWYWGISPCIQMSVSGMGQKLSRWLDTTRLSLSVLSPLENQSVRDVLFGEGYIRNLIKILLRTKSISEMVWRRLHILFVQWAQDIDFTTTGLEIWFRIAKLRFDCHLFLVETMKKLRETGTSAIIAWNMTVTIVCSTWRESISRPSTSYTNEHINLRTSRSTKPIDFPFKVNFSSVGNGYNQTMTSDPIFPNVAFCSKSTISFLKAHDIHSFWVPIHLNSHSSFGHLSKNHNSYSGSVDADVFIFNDNDEQLFVSYSDTVDTIRRKSDELSPYMYGNWRLPKLPKDNITSSLQKNQSIPEEEEGEPMNYYAASFPTVPNNDEGGEDLFASVNLMEMASEITRRFLPRRRRRHTRK